MRTIVGGLLLVSLFGGCRAAVQYGSGTVPKADDPGTSSTPNPQAALDPSKVPAVFADLAQAGTALDGSVADLAPAAAPADGGAADLLGVGADLKPSCNFNGQCEPGESCAACPADCIMKQGVCCDEHTACGVFTADPGQPPTYCRAINSGGYGWITESVGAQLCGYSSQACIVRYRCGGSTGWCMHDSTTPTGVAWHPGDSCL
jgi:hypothetical protein